MPKPTETISWLPADWPAPAHIHAGTTTRNGGYSDGPYSSFNFGHHVKDDPENMWRNRRALVSMLALPSEPYWLEQVHSARVMELLPLPPGRQRLRRASAPAKLAGRPGCGGGEGILSQVDGTYTSTPGQVCAILTADCLPLLLCNCAGTEVLALHGGWRGLAGGIIANGITKMRSPANEIIAWLGPAIGPQIYEIDDKVRDVFVNLDPDFTAAFTPTHPGHWLFDLYTLARLQLNKLGITAVYGGGHCTYTESDTFFSFRKSPVTGRMASLIWIA